MKETDELGEQLPTLPPRLFERLAQLSGYTWDQSVEPFHSSYDNWHIFGIRHERHDVSANNSLHGTARSTSTRTSPNLGSRPSFKNHDTSASDAASDFSSAKLEPDRSYTPIIARISTHTLRLEREFHLCKSLIQTSDPNCDHTVRPVDLLRLPAQRGDAGSMVVSIFESPGRNYLKDLLDFGPAWFRSGHASCWDVGPNQSYGSSPPHQISLIEFLDFAIGASECLELLHHGKKLVHGEIRADAFHFNRDTGSVKLVNFGSGPRSFENGLTSSGWSSLSREIGIKNKLQYVAPEQTNRMSAEPDSRTDIYSLGILFWTMLTREPAFDGTTPMDILQSVLGRRIVPVSTRRTDVPEIVSRIIQKMTQKNIDERYHSISGLKHDLREVQRILVDADFEALQTFNIGTKDVSSFFVLPTEILGRTEDQEKVAKIIDKVSRRQKATLHTLGPSLSSISSNSASSLLDSRLEGIENGTARSDGSSQAGHESRTSPTVVVEPPFLGLALKVHQDSLSSVDSFNSINNHQSEYMSSQDLGDTRSSTDTRADTQRSRPTSGYQNDSVPIPKRLGSRNLRRKGRCEAITIVGAAGLGKSSFVQSFQGEIRKLGYFASVKFDPARKAPFEPLLRGMGSIFRQIFSESNVNTDYHNSIRANVRGFWPSLCTMLQLPEKLISLDGQQAGKPSSSSSQLGTNWSARPDTGDSSSTHSSSSGISGSRSMSEFLRGGANTRSLRFTNTFLEILRVLSANKLICLSLDDLQSADEESLDLISNIITGQFRIVLMITCREEDLFPSNLQAALDSPKANVTKIHLAPLTEEEVINYVATTLYRSQEYVFPLAAVCLDKTRGNPFYLRQMLEVCHRKNCIWYSWKDSVWQYDLDRVFSEFQAENYGQLLNTQFTIRQLQEQLPPASRAIVAWASLIGNTFSFALIRKLLTGEFDDAKDYQGDEMNTCSKEGELFMAQPAEDVVDGLQAALQAYILVPGADDDHFRFSHERYIQASASLRTSVSVEKMHFIIASTMMKYSNLDDCSLYARARHVCLAANLIKRHIYNRSRFRELLFEAGQKAVAEGARPTGLWYYETCLFLMQSDPWKDGAYDVSYDETLELYTKAAELYWHQGQPSKAFGLLASTFIGARTASDKAPSWILQSKLHASRGDLLGAFKDLTTSLCELGLPFPVQTSWKSVDKDYKNVYRQLQNMSLEEIEQRPLSNDPNVISMGAVLVQAISAAYWSDALLFYQIAVKMVGVFLSHGTFNQAGLGFAYFASISVTRFANLAFGHKMYKVSQRLLRRFHDYYTSGRILTISALFNTHLFSPIREHLDLLEEGFAYTLASGDKIFSIISVGSLALFRLYLGYDMIDIESFCTYAPEEFGDWGADLRGGAILMATRQVSRSLQGKTWYENADTVMSDENHDTAKYMDFIAQRTSSVARVRDVYNSLLMIPLYLFGHYDHAIQVGSDMMLTIRDMWSIRNSHLTLFYLSLSLLAKLREHPVCSEREETLSRVQGYKGQIKEWLTECDVNYLMWSLLIEAEILEITGDYHGSIQAYEAAIDHTEVHGFALEQALAFELQGENYMRRGAKRAARTTLKDAIATYSRISASGKAKQLSAKHEWLLKTAIDAQTVDVGIQTANSIGDIGNTQYRIEENERQETRNFGKESAGDRTKAWVTPGAVATPKDSNPDTDLSGLKLDIIDLQSILEFNQAISSELQIDRLLAKMTEIILESAGAQADFAGVVIEADDGGWCIAASGNQDSITSEALPLDEVADETAKQVLLYTIRFRETVFVHNLVNDDRFCNAPAAKSVIALPILHGEDLLGVLYLEGKPRSFTDRNLGVLQLFCNQVGISISNALLFRQVKKVSASNTSMIESQKRALIQAREAENKAKIAEAEAMRNVRLKEEAAKAKSMFLANVSHELRTPLNGVIGMSELLKGTLLNQEQEGYADSIRVCADTLLTVINDILDFSKLEAGKMQLFSIPLNLRETITEVVRALSYTNWEQGLKTIEDLDLDPKLLVIGDPVRLHQIFMNLLSNSYKFTAKGSVTVRSRTEYEDDSSIRVTCSVIDTGIGITQEQLTRLFKPFSQADSSTQRSYGGSGLGLSICKALIHVLNGKIWLESQPGLGTNVSFTLTFPKAPREATANSTEISARDPDPMATWSSKMDDTALPLSNTSSIDLSEIPREKLRICIAEDNPINQKIAISFVTKLGFKSDAYSDGKQAVDALRRQSKAHEPYHLVLMDCQMPVLDGYDATRMIRKDADPAVRRVLIIAMTASAIRGDREKCLEAGMNNYLAKPVRAAVLKTMLEDYLNQPPKPIPDLQKTATNLAINVIGTAHEEPKTQNGRPKLPKKSSTRKPVPSRDETKTPTGAQNVPSLEKLPIRPVSEVLDRDSVTPTPLRGEAGNPTQQIPEITLSNGASTASARLHQD